MVEWNARWILMGLLCAAAAPWTILAPLSAHAEEGGAGEEPRWITTSPEDRGFGEQPVHESSRFRDLSELRGLVDERGAHNPLADRNIAWSNGYIAPAGTVQLSTALLFSFRIAYSWRDDVRFFVQAAPEQFDQTYWAMGGDFHVAEGDAWTLTLGTQLRHRQTMLLPGTNQSGLGFSAIFDVIASDRLSWSAGMSTNVALRQEVERQVALDCDNRRQVLEGCSEVVGDTRWFPGSGYWVAFHAGANFHVSERLVLNAEAFSGLSQGNFWLMEAWLDERLPYTQEMEVVEQSSWQAGLGPIGPLTVGLGATWRWRRLGMQGALLLIPLDGEMTVLPHFSLAMNFGGGR